MPRVILAVFLGYALIGVLIYGADMLYVNVPRETYYPLVLITDTIFTLTGGWLCGLISRRDTRAAWGLIVMGEVMGVASTIYLWNTVPHYYSFYLLIMFPLAVWYGAKIGRI